MTQPWTVLIGASRYRQHSCGNNHPLDIPRVSLTVDLIRALNALDVDDYRVSRKATITELKWLHTPKQSIAKSWQEILI